MEPSDKGHILGPKDVSGQCVLSAVSFIRSVLIQSVLYSECPLFRVSFIQSVLCSEVPLFKVSFIRSVRVCFIQSVLYSKCPLFRVSFIRGSAVVLTDVSVLPCGVH